MSVLRLLPALLATIVLLAACGDGQEAREPDATRVTADEAAQAAAILGLEEQGRASWSAREYTGGAFRFENFELTLGEAEEASGETGAVLRAEIMEIASPYLEGDIVRFDRLSLENAVLYDSDGGETRFERLVIDRPGPALSRAVAASFTGSAPALPDLAGNLAAYSFRELALTGLAVTLPGEEGALQASTVTLRGLDETGLELASVESIRFDSPAVRFGIETARIEGVGSRMLAAMFRDSDASPLQLMITGSPADYYRQLEITGLAGVANGMAFEMDSLAGEVTPEGESLRTLASMPSLRLRAEADSDPGAQVEAALGFLGYEEIVLRFETDAVYDPATDTIITQNNNRFIWEDGLTLDAHQEIIGVQAYSDAVATAHASGIADPQTLAALESLLRLQRLEVRLEDQSLLDRSFSAYALMNGVTPAQMRVQASALIALGLSALPAEIPRPFLNAIAGPLSDFVRDGGTLVIALDPPAPVPLPELTSASGEFDIDQLGLSVSVERSE